MFTKEERKEFLIKYGKKWFFPDFSKKITWYVVTLGAGIIITPTPLKVIFYNWLIATFNLNSSEYFSLSEVSSGTADYWVGFSLIFVSLAHNIFSNWFSLQENISNKSELLKIREVDQKMFEMFLEVFPSGSRAAHLLENHDFGNSFHLVALQEIDKFVNEWNCPEKHFITPELEVLRKELWEKCNEFSNLMALKTSPVHGSSQSVVHDTYKNDWEWPAWVENDIKEVNEMASVVFKMHQNFIKSVRCKLSC